MKRLLTVLLAVLVLCTTAVYAADIPVYINGEALEFDVTPQMINDRVMVPMRFIFEKLGATVSYDDETQTITAYRVVENGDNVIILIQIDNPKAFVNNDSFELDSPPVLVDGRTLVPVRFVSEALGCKVEWNEAEEAVYITAKAAEVGEDEAAEEKLDKTQDDSENIAVGEAEDEDTGEADDEDTGEADDEDTGEEEEEVVDEESVEDAIEE